MSKQWYQEVVGWGVGLWLFGYLLGIAVFFILPPAILGWVIMPVGILASLWVLLKKIPSAAFQHFVFIAVGWTCIAVVCDYLFLVTLFKPADGYYKPDVYLYYLLTFVLPLAVGWYKNKKSKTETTA